MLFKKRTQRNLLKVDDIVLLAMLNFPNGVVGESTIHEFIYNLVDLESYNCMKEQLSFLGVDGGLHFSKAVHKSVVDNCRDVTNVERGSFSSPSSTAAIFSDDLRFELYEEVCKKEDGFKELISGYSPKIYFLSAMGRSVAILALKEKLNRDQKEVVKGLAELYDNI
jgi:hypothetical protein